MRVGFKLDVDFDTSVAYQRLFGDGSVLVRLKELGVEAVEFPLGPASDLDEVAVTVRQCHSVGLLVSFHPYTEGQEANPAHFEGPRSHPAIIHERFFGLAAQMSRDQGETIVNVHPAAASANRASRVELLERSVHFFSWANDWCAEHSSDVRAVAELQVAPDEGEGLIRIGDTPEELAQVVERSEAGACWDVGHSEWNNRRFGTSRHPTEQLWKRIVHVHCHDVDDEGDHRVLRRGDTHWRRFLQDLAGTDYAGTVVIEVAPETFLEAGGPQALEESIAVVTEAASN
jgi:sugar phosphate isomerase/epimerase